MAEVERLRLLNALTKHGHAIGGLVEMSHKELQALVRELQTKPDLLNPLIQAVGQFDAPAIDRHLLKARLDMPARSFVLEVVAPLLGFIGELVSSEKLSIAQEHVFSSVLRNHLGELLSQVRKTSHLDSPGFAFATPEGDHHEFGILMAAILAGGHGFRFHYLGPNLPALDLARAVQTLGARLIVIGLVGASEGRLTLSLEKTIKLLDHELCKTPSLEIWLGGPGALELKPKQFKTPVVRLHSLADFEQRLHQMAKHTQERSPS